MGNSRKVMVIGWDAADWNVIYPMIKEGKMPTLAKFLSEGVHGNLATLNPPLSPMLWTSIATGKRAYDHGILGFTEPMPDGSGVRPVSSTSRKVKAIWNILNQHNYQSNVVGWWPSQPAEPINGVMVSNIFQLAKGQSTEDWPLIDGTIYPKEFIEPLKELRMHPNELTSAHILPFVPLAAELSLKDEAPLQVVLKTLAHCSSIHNASTYLAEETEWDFLAVYHDAIDHMCHGAMKFHPPKLPGISDEDFKKYRHVVDGIYRFHDMMLERMLDFATEDTTVIIVSDHGFHSDHLRPLRLPKEPAAPAMEHSPYGIFAAKGPGIKKNDKIYGASLLDVTPTLLSLYDLPVAKDMEGRVLTQIYEKPKKVEYIDSWEHVPGKSGEHPKGLDEDPYAAQETMNQLIELGYIDKPDENKAKAIEKTIEEGQYNLARTYSDTGKHAEAIPILENLIEKDPQSFRYSYYLLQSYLATNKLDKCEALIEQAKKFDSEEVSKLDYYEGLVLISKGWFRKAQEKFEEVSHKFRASSSINNQIGKAYRLQEKWEEALGFYNQSLEVNPKNAQAWHGKGICLLKLNKVEEALECFFQAIEILYFFPHAHYYIGECFLALEMYENAAESFEVSLKMAPRLNKARQWLVKLYTDHIPNQQAAEKHQSMLPNQDQEIIIVSGLPRSGTSMLMQMLDAGGIPILTDKIRTADDNNPKGYYEYDPVKGLRSDAKWMDKAVGKAIKIVSPLIDAIPEKYKYKIIIIERPLHEVLVSQQVMLGKSRAQALESFPYQMAADYQRQIKRINSWIENRPFIELLKLKHADVISNPLDAAKSIQQFLGKEMDINSMAEIVDAKLNRSNLK